MSKELYEEALADVKKVTMVAEDNAKRAVLEAVTPRIRELIEKELLKEAFNDEDDELLLDDPAIMPSPSAGAVASADAISPPDEEGKVTLDLDALDPCDDEGDDMAPAVAPPGAVPAADEYELGLESLEALTPILNATRVGSMKEFELNVYKLAESIDNFKKASKVIRESAGFLNKIAQMISHVENMYGYVQESVTDPGLKKKYELKLEGYFQDLTKLQEQKMKKNLREMMNEDDMDLDVGDDEAVEAGDEGDVEGGGELTLKLTGLPDDVDLDDVGVDLVAGADDEDLDVGDDEGGEGDEDVDLGDLDLGGDEGDEGGEEEEVSMEALGLSDDTVVEIDEGMLRREISRMAKLREQSADKPGDANGYGVDSAAMDDFGDGDDDGEPFLDGEVTTEGDDMADMGEMEDIAMEMDDEDGDVMPEADVAESLKRRISFERRLQERAKKRAASLKREAAKARPARKQSLKKEYARTARRFNESVARLKNYTQRLNEASAKRSRSNSGSSRLAESSAVNNLRKELAGKNLVNTKLVYTTKLLQNESLSRAQKAQIIERLDEAKTAREAKLVYESLTKTLAKKPLNEGRKPLVGSSSRATRSASAQTLSEGFETDRWARLAGINK